MKRTTRSAIITVVAGIIGATLTGTSAAQPAAADQNPVYFVHGWGGPKDCDETWGNAVDYFADEQGMQPSKLYLLRYYDGDYESKNCRDGVNYPDISNDGNNDGTRDTRIKHVAAAFAHQLASHDGEKIDIVAHSMGGLVTRVALLGTAQGWDGFPKDADGSPADLNVDDVITLGTPHKGVRHASHSDTQWESMLPDSEFMRVLHLPENRLSEPWAKSVDWSFAGTLEDDETVAGESAIDLNYRANHKYLYHAGNNPPITHGKIRSQVEGDHHFNLRHVHNGGNPTDTTEGRSPVALAWRAITDKDR